MSKNKSMAKKAMDDPELQDMFNQMTGTSEPDPKIIAPKYEGILTESVELIKIIEAVFVTRENIPAEVIADFSKVFADMEAFVTSAHAELKSLTLDKTTITAGASLAAANYDPKNIINVLQALERGYDLTKLGDIYKTLKTCNTMDRLIIAIRDLRKAVEEDKKENHKKVHDLDNKDTLSDSFITTAAGDYFVLLPSLCGMDFKQMLLHPKCNSIFRQRIKFALYVILKKGATIIQHIMSPDIDIEKFSVVLIENIGKLRKAIPRCDKAFNKIQKSVELLKTNFSGYYKDFVVSKNPGIIVESFVVDVAGSSTADSETTRQFGRIIDFYRQKTKNQKQDPQVDKIFELLGANMRALEAKTGQSYKKSNTDDAPEKK
jgi:hypothetical protein